MVNPYQFWRDALAGKAPPIVNEEPQCGYYRTRMSKGGPFLPVAIWLSDGVMTGLLNNTEISRRDLCGRWPWIAANPISEEEYRKVAEQGGVWSDQDEIVARQQTGNMGDNSGDDFDTLKDQITSAAAGKQKYMKIRSHEHSQQGQSLRSRLLELAGQATKIKKRLADPPYDEWKKINAKWNPVIEAAEGAAKAIKKANDDWLTEQLHAQRKAEAEAAQSDMMETPEPTVVVPTQVKGTYGRALSIKTGWVLDKIEDQDRVYAHFKNSAAIKECLEDLTRRAIKAGEDVPGTLRKEAVITK